MKFKPLLFVAFIATLINNHSVAQSAVAGMQTAPATQTAPVVTQNASAVRFVAPQPEEKLQQANHNTEAQTIQPRISLTAPSGDPENGRPAQKGNLPESASTLPLLTVIGAGVLIGGLSSARKTRRAKVR